jgi:hypothetical protein
MNSTRKNAFCVCVFCIAKLTVSIFILIFIGLCVVSYRVVLCVVCVIVFLSFVIDDDKENLLTSHSKILYA